MVSQTSMAALEELAERASDGVFVVDRQRRYLLFNAACERLTGYGQDEVLGRDCSCGQVVECRDSQGRSLSGFLCPAKAIFDGSIGWTRQHMQIRRKDGSIVWVETVYAAVRHPGGEVAFVLGVMREVSPTEKAKSLSEAEPSACPTSLPSDPHRLDEIIADVERQTIRQALAAVHWQRNKAADLMGISRSRLYRRMEALGIDPDEHA